MGLSDRWVCYYQGKVQTRITLQLGYLGCFFPFGLAQAARPSLVNMDKVPRDEASSGATSSPGS